MTQHHVVEPYPTITTPEGPAEVLVVDTDSGRAQVRRGEVDPTTGGTDYEEWETTLDPAAIALLVQPRTEAPPEVPPNVALGGAHDIKRALLAQGNSQ